jgi:ferredoxin
VAHLAVPVGVFSLAFVLLLVGPVWARRRRRRRARALPPREIRVHAINDDRCTGCDACVNVCPTEVLELVRNKSRVIRFEQCIQCQLCQVVCPTQALVMHPPREEPQPILLPNLDEFYQTNVPGLYLIGEASGKPLCKNASNLGRAVVEHARASGLAPGALGSGGVDVDIVGSGPA